MRPRVARVERESAADDREDRQRAEKRKERGAADERARIPKSRPAALRIARL
jgi:hypothetical protein